MRTRAFIWNSKIRSSHRSSNKLHKNDIYVKENGNLSIKITKYRNNMKCTHAHHAIKCRNNDREMVYIIHVIMIMIMIYDQSKKIKLIAEQTLLFIFAT